VATHWIDERAAFEEILRDIEKADLYAVDTEFHRERTYFPQVALVQLAWDDEIALVDPLQVDLQLLCGLLDGPGLAIMHAASQDLEVLQLVCGSVPARLFDTQVAAGFLGHSSPGLATLLQSELGVRLPKADRLTDWLARPLGPEQREYAAADVHHLRPLYETLAAKLDAKGRLGWALDECEEVRQRERGPRNPEDAWQRIKEARQLRGRALAVAQSVAAWRERRAADVDQPVRFLLPDLAVVGIAQRPPKTIDELRRIRGLDDRHVRRPYGREILDAVEEGLAAPIQSPPTMRSAMVPRDLRPAVALVSAWVSQLARETEIDTALLATRADIEALVSVDEDSRLAHGWRAELAGQPIRNLVDGHAALAFDGHGNLVLERRSGEPFGV
jgi:ribonuclease D